jgi:hypothetical protein
MDTSLLLRTDLGIDVLGQPCSLALYARNGFRLIGMPPTIDEQQLATAAQGFENRLKLDATFALRDAVPTGYDADAALDGPDYLEAIRRLRTPRSRLLAGIFWPMADGDALKTMRRTGMGSDETLSALRSLREAVERDDEVAVVQSLAVVLHNRAVAHELRVARDAAPPDDTTWTAAHAAWSELLASASFWNLLDRRVDQVGDFRLTAADVGTLRESIPELLARMHAAFARSYAAAGDWDACFRHVRHVSSDLAPAPVRERVFMSLIADLLGLLVEPIRDQARAKLAERAKGSTRSDFANACDPILDAAFDACTRAVELFGEEAVRRHSAFDELAGAVLTGVNRIDYQSVDRPRALLYSMIVAKRLLQLPLSTLERQHIEQNLRSDTKHMYDVFAPRSHDPCACWFIEGETADPDASIPFSFHRVTDREVQVDRARMSAGISLKWQKRTLLVPRSKLAAERHRQAGGKAEIPSIVREIPEAARTPEQRAACAKASELEASLPGRVETRSQRALDEVDEVRHDFATRIARAEVECARDVEAHEAAIEGKRAQLEDDLARSRQEHDEQRARLCADNARETDPFSRTLAKVTYSQRLPRSLYRFELPLVTAGAVPAFVFLPPIVAGAGALVFAAAAGQLVRRYRIGRARRAVTSREEVGARRLRELEAEAEARATAIRSEFERFRSSRPPSESALRELRAQVEPAVARVREVAEQDIQQLTRDNAAEVHALRAQCQVTVPVRPERDRIQFPSIADIRKAGWKDDERPPRSEFDMTFDEQTRARRMLGL